MLARRERRQLRYAGASTASRGAQGCKCFAAAAAFVVGSDGPSPCSLDASVASFVTLAFSTALRGAGLQVHCCSRCLRRRLWWAVAVLAQCERCQLRYAGVSTAVRGAQGCKCFAAAAAFVVGYGVGRRRARSMRASPASLRWRFHRFARCKAASALQQPLPSSSALVGRRRARSMRALPASLRWRFHRCARCRAACALPQPLSSPSALGRRRARSTRASPASLRWRFPPLCAV